MMDYRLALSVAVMMAVLLLVQLLIADVLALKHKHPPGFIVKQSHSSALFRASRAFANTNETIAIFTLLLVSGVLLGADPRWINQGALLYFVARIAHMLCYYLQWALARSAVFVISLLGLVLMLVACVQALWF